MNEEHADTKKLIDTTDCLEAVGVFRGWKNFLFVLIIICLLLVQASFWLIDLGYTKSIDDVEQANKKSTETQPQQPSTTDKIKEASEKVVADSNQPVTVEKAAIENKQKTQAPKFSIKYEQAEQLVRLVNFVLIPTAVLYCLTLLFSLKVSLLGRMGGISHISRAFFISLLIVVFMLPWQKYFPGVFTGAMFTLDELLTWRTKSQAGDMFCKGLYYLRFAGYWLLILILLIFSQFRSARWAKTILRRLEVI